MRHIADGLLRRLDDEPLAVPDRVSDHLEGCPRCRARHAAIAADSARVGQLLSAPQLVPDPDLAWLGIQHQLGRAGAERTAPTPVRLPARRPPFPRISLRAGLALGATGAVLAGTAAAATLTTIFAPNHVAAVPVSQNDFRAVVALAGLGDTHMLGGFAAPAGSTAFRFGTITWSSSRPEPATTVGQAAKRAGFPVTEPTRLPRGVGALQQLTVQPRLHASVTFSARAARLSGSSVTIDAGPAVLAEYRVSGTSGQSILAVVSMRRPTAQSTGASLAQVKAFLLSRPGVPPELVEEMRLLGDLRTTLPVPVPSGVRARSVRIHGWPAILLADGTNAAAAVVWEDGQNLLHAVVGILDSQDVLDVAKQLV